MSLRSLILEGCEALDPNHQGLGWPDPIKWDGRPLREIATDLCALLDAQGEFRDLSDKIWQAANR
jgi:stress response protein SCP2